MKNIDTTKTLKSILTILIAVFIVSACSEEVTKTPSNDEISISIEKPDFRTILFGNDKSESRIPIPNFFIRVESDLVSANEGCYTVNVRVYLTVDGVEYLVANDNVQVGDCNQNRYANSDCNGLLADGNYVFENNTDDEICLYEVLSKNQKVYNQYTTSVNNLINSLKN